MPIPQFNTEGKGLYQPVAAAMLWRNFSGVCVYVKHKKGPSEIRIKSQTSNATHLITPDRELYICRDGSYTSHVPPSGDNWDECYDFNLLNDGVAKSLGINITMTNYVHENPKYLINDRNKYTVEDRALFLSDSGGLQMLRGQVSEPINPVDLAKFYSKNVDAGMTLDLPIGNSDRKIFVAAAELQKANTNCMLEVLKEEKSQAGLLNIFHGYTTEERRIYRDIVEDKRITRAAMGGLYRGTLLTATNIILEITMTGQSYEQYHALGIYNYAYVALLVKIANATKKFITSDTTSFIQYALNRMMVHHEDENVKPTNYNVGRATGTGNIHRYLNHQCPVCTSVKYTDALGTIDSDANVRLMAIHNFIAMSNYANMMQHAVLQLSSEEYNQLVYRQLSKNRHLKEIKLCFDFIEHAAEDGLLKAQKRYANHLNRLVVGKNENNTLFNTESFSRKDYASAIEAGHKMLRGETVEYEQKSIRKYA
jgi:hypothetical protein